MSAEYDLIIRGGTVVTQSSRAIADVGILGEQVAQVGGLMTGKDEINAAGKLVLPGGIDAHVHLTWSGEPDESPQWCDDFASGTRAAAAGGVTAVGNMVFPRRGETLYQAMMREVAEAEATACVDVFLHPVLMDPMTQPLSDIERLVADGHTSLKMFMSFGGFAVDAAPYIEALRIAARLNVITLVHCEDAVMLEDSLRNLVATGRTGIEFYPLSRTPASEASATARIADFAEQTGAPIYVVHLSSEAALNEVRAGRARGLPMWIETRPLYLHLTEERFREPDGAKYVGQPPLRRQSDREALWSALAGGEIDTVCTDHAPWQFADKVTPGIDITSIRAGVADLDTMLPMLFSEGVTAGRITLERFVAVSSTNAAKLFGLYPRKGTIAPGSDADIVIWDPNRTKPVRAEAMATNSDYSPYEGWGVTGWPELTMCRGRVIWQDGRLGNVEGWGRVPRRELTRPL